MNDLCYQIIPPAIFLFGFFIVFSLFEFLIVFLLNRLTEKYWEFVVDRLIRFQVKHRKMISIISILFVILWFVFIYSFYLRNIFLYSTTTINILAGVLLLIILLIYYLSVHRTLKIEFQKRVYRYFYIFLSLILYAFILGLASTSYLSYQQYVNVNFVYPAMEKVDDQVDQHKKEMLLEQFRASFEAGECIPVDYEEKDPNLVHFIYVGSDSETSSDDFSLKGMKCSDTENTFLRTEEGEWYWVIEG